MRCASKVTRRQSARPRAGFTLVELLVAILLIDVAVLGLVAGTAMLARRDVEQRTRVAAVQLAANRIQRLIAGPCVAAVGVESTPRGQREEWSVVLLPNAVRDVHDSVAYVEHGIAKSVVLHSRGPC